MSVRPISMKSGSNQDSSAKNKLYSAQMDKTQAFELENALTVRENEEISVSCVVESSKPAADIKFSITSPSQQNNNDDAQLFPFGGNSIASSIVSSNINTIKNPDKTYKTIYTARLKANLEDHGKLVSCKAENGFGQKWENKKPLNIKCIYFYLKKKFLIFI